MISLNIVSTPALEETEQDDGSDNRHEADPGILPLYSTFATGSEMNRVGMREPEKKNVAQWAVGELFRLNRNADKRTCFFRLFFSTFIPLLFSSFLPP